MTTNARSMDSTLKRLWRYEASHLWRAAKLAAAPVAIWMILIVFPYVVFGESWGMAWFYLALPMSASLKPMWDSDAPWIYVLTATAAQAAVVSALVGTGILLTAMETIVIHFTTDTEGENEMEREGIRFALQNDYPSAVRRTVFAITPEQGDADVIIKVVSWNRAPSPEARSSVVVSILPESLNAPEISVSTKGTWQEAAKEAAPLIQAWIANHRRQILTSRHTMSS
jgi:hypothetical protein